MIKNVNPMLFFYLTVLAWLIAWAGCTAIARLPSPAPFSAVWNKFWAIVGLIAGLIAFIWLVFGSGGLV